MLLGGACKSVNWGVGGWGVGGSVSSKSVGSAGWGSCKGMRYWRGPYKKCDLPGGGGGGGLPKHELQGVPCKSVLPWGGGGRWWNLCPK